MKLSIGFIQPLLDFVIKTGKTRFALSCLALLVIAFMAKYTTAPWYAYAAVVAVTSVFVIFRSLSYKKINKS